MDIKGLKENLDKDIGKLGFHLYDLKYSKNDNILSVIIDESLDLNKIEDLSKKISKIMDKYDESFNNYILDVCSAGIERPIKTLEEVKKNINEYVNIKLDKKSIEGTIRKVNGDIIQLEYLDKNIKKMMDVNYKKIKKIRKAVKIWAVLI